MKKIKNKFIILILISVILVVLLWIFKSYFLESKDKNSFAVLIEWKWIVNDKLLKLNEKKQLKVWDLVRTIGDNSLIVVEWWDWSLTRIWWNSSIKIDELLVDNNLLKINLSFELLSWKSWSNVINFMWEWSYFKESFRDIEAWVRWTVFNVDLDNDYISVVKHKISLLRKTDNKSFEINEEKPFSLKTFSFIDLAEFIKSIQNKAFEELNKKFDTEYFKILKNNIISKLEYFKSLSNINVSELTKEKKDALYEELLAKYQQLNFISSENKELFSKKLEYKKVLIELASEKDKIALIENTLYDFKESIISKNYWNLKSIIPILENNLGLIKWLKINFNDYFSNNVIPEELKSIFNENLNLFESIFGWNLLERIKNINFEDVNWIQNNIQNKIIEGKNKIQDKISEGLDSLFIK